MKAVPMKENTSKDPALQILRDVFGYQEFRGLQRTVINRVLERKNTLVLMPTGGGKSLCYQIPALCMNGVAVVVSPLIALMQDQVAGLKQSGIRAETLNSSSSDVSKVYAALERGTIDLLYVSPERLLREDFLAFLKKVGVSLFAIDEAHCISRWGHDFRPVYTRLSVLGTLFAGVPRLALTATADETTRRDILKQLDMENAETFVSSFNRPNIRYAAVLRENEKAQILSFLKNGHAGESGIIYCATRNAVEDNARFLKENGFEVFSYHAGLTSEVREKNQDAFIKSDAAVMVATIAFGMGINKPDVRYVVHTSLPKDIESYYQETGRAGRDGLPAEALLIYGAKDLILQRGFIEASDASPEQKGIERKKLDAVVGYAETAGCRRRVLLEYFGETAEEKCDNCDNCNFPPDVYDARNDMLKLLSCIYRIKAKSGKASFGTEHTIDVLTGKKTEKALKFGHETLSTFGIGANVPRRVWKALVRQALIAGFVKIETDYSGLELTEAAFAFFKKPYAVNVRKDATSRLKKTPSPVRASPETQNDRKLTAALKKLRLSLARAENLPAYYIFSDKSLTDMADKKPVTKAEFAEVYGVGRNKLEKYADAFVEVVKAYADKTSCPK